MECEPISNQRKKYQRNALELPPCFVCSGLASGIHYGVNTCTGCKMFFQRYLKRDSPFICKKSGNCKIIDSNRGNCSACRANKCLSVGMAREGIRMGRYTATERSIKIKEVNKLKASRNHTRGIKNTCIRNETLLPHDENTDNGIDCIANESASSDGYASENSPSTVSSNTLTLPMNQENNGPTEIDEDRVRDLSPNAHFCIFTDTVMRAMKKSQISSGNLDIKADSSGLNVLSKIMENRPNSDSQSSFSSDYSERLSNQHTGTPDSPDSLSSLDSGIVEPKDSFSFDELTESYLAMTTAPQLKDEEIKRILKEGSDRYQDKVRLFGSLNPLSLEEYKTVRKETGLDIDGREAMVQQWQKMELKFFEDFVKFVHLIPEFKDLPVSDQITLLKASICDIDVFLNYRFCDADLEMMMWPTADSVYHIQQICMFDTIETCRTYFEISKNVQALNLSFQEAALSTAISITFRDRCKLQDPDKVERIQWKLIEKLQKSLKNRLKDISKVHKTFSRMIDIFIQCRDIYDKSRKTWIDLSNDEFIQETGLNISSYFNIE